MENNTIENEVRIEKIENGASIEKNEKREEKLNEFHMIPILDNVDVKTDGVNKSDYKRKNKEMSSNQHNNSPVILEMKKSKRQTKRMEK